LDSLTVHNLSGGDGGLVSDFVIVAVMEGVPDAGGAETAAVSLAESGAGPPVHERVAVLVSDAGAPPGIVPVTLIAGYCSPGFTASERVQVLVAAEHVQPAPPMVGDVRPAGRTSVTWTLAVLCAWPEFCTMIDHCACPPVRNVPLWFMEIANVGGSTGTLTVFVSCPPPTVNVAVTATVAGAFGARSATIVNEMVVCGANTVGTGSVQETPRLHGMNVGE
jgi:hypothetical protein